MLGFEISVGGIHRGFVMCAVVSFMVLACWRVNLVAMMCLQRRIVGFSNVSSWLSCFVCCASEFFCL